MKRLPSDQVMMARNSGYATQKILNSRDWTFYIKAQIRKKGSCGCTIHGFRKLANLRQSELAQMLGISQSAVSLLETGRYRLKAKFRDKLAEIFGCSASLFA